jgi:YggT family protein
VIARILLSWFPNSGANQIKSFLRDVTEPYLAFFRNLIPRVGMLDISPIIALFALDLIKGVLLFIVASFLSR